MPSSRKGRQSADSWTHHRYADLVEEWRNGQPVDSCETKSWEASYTALHADMLSGQARAPSLLEYRCRLGEHCGGFADRCVLVAPLCRHTICSTPDPDNSLDTESSA